MHTNSHMNNCQFIIHAIGPDMSNYKRREKECYDVLRETFLNVLTYAEEKLKAASIALPLISSGIFGVPKNVSCDMLYEAILQFISNTFKSSDRNLKCIKIISIDTETNSEILKVFKNNLSKKKGFKIEDNDEIKTSVEDKPNDLKWFESVKKEMEKREEEKFGKCTVCESEKKLKLSLECGCNYCSKCVDNYTLNGDKCCCPEKEAEA